MTPLVKLKRAIRLVQARFPFEIRWTRSDENAPLPAPTLDLIGPIAAYFAAVRPGSVLLQIGAADGVSYDSALSKILPTGALQAVLVEPLPDQFAKLENRYASVPSVTTLCAAVSTVDGEATIFRVRQQGRWAGSADAPLWSSLDRAHLHKHGVSDDEIDSVSVPALTLGTVLARLQLGRIDVLVIDTEGFDAEIVRMALALPTPPACIYFERIHLAHADKIAILNELSHHGYVFAHDAWNTLALHDGLTREWTQGATG